MSFLVRRVALYTNARVYTTSYGSKCCRQLEYSTFSFDEFENESAIGKDIGEGHIVAEKRQLQPQGVDPKKGWNFRGVHKAIICGKIGQPPIQKILRNGRTATIFTIGTGGMFDQRITVEGNSTPKPAQWHRIVVHNEQIGAYAVQKLLKNSSVYVEGDIETRVYNDNINGQVKNIPEICVRHDGKVRLVSSTDGVGSSTLDDLRRGLF